ncbi:glutaminyl-peptide cyclotransferase [Bacteroidia bacterium]|nr:glutaminyl-peptide cyclotransferase [Bacteroidia bacterium]
MQAQPKANLPRQYTYNVVHAYPHDDRAYTQGLEFHNGTLYESTGVYGQSALRKVALETGRVVANQSLAGKYFGEGLTLLNGLLYQLTWQEGLCFVYDAATLRPLHQVRYTGEGWGLANDGSRLIMSDGSHIIRFLSPQNFSEEKRITIYNSTGYVNMLNELEMVEGELWANIYGSSLVARIDTASGAVLGMIDLTGILPPAQRTSRTDVLNGIAYDAVGKRIFVTGKNWSRLFEIKVIPKK